VLLPFLRGGFGCTTRDFALSMSPWRAIALTTLPE
jgi:hypothetical protein